MWVIAAALAAEPGLALRPAVDAPVLAASATYAVTTLWLLPDRPVLDVARSPEPLGFDADVAPRDRVEGAIPLASDVLSYGGAGLGLVGAAALGAIDGEPGGRGRGALTHGVIFAESVAVTVSLTDIVKTASRRPRPYTRAAGFTWGDADDQMSFPSGHTSTAGAAAFSLARQITMTRPCSPAATAGVYGLAAVATASTGVLRVAAARHYPSDVVVGGVLGASVGLLVPELHRATGLRVGVGRAVGGQTIELTWTDRVRPTERILAAEAAR